MSDETLGLCTRLLPALLIAGCPDPIESPTSTTSVGGFEGTSGGAEFDERPVARAAEAPPPITGGTLLVTADGAFAVASDPARSVVHIVDLEASEPFATIPLEHGTQPFRAAEDAAGLVHITLRGSGQLATIDPHAGALVGVVSTCANPRGVAYDGGAGEVLVACAGGDLIALDPASRAQLRRHRVAPDLRDVVIADGRVLATRFRSAEVFAVDADGNANIIGVPESVNLSGEVREPNTAWRTVGVPNGGWLMMHQLGSTNPLGGGSCCGDGGSSDDGGFGPESLGGYVGGTLPCGGASVPAASAMRPDGTMVAGGALDRTALVVDIAISGDAHSIVVASPSQHDGAFTGTRSVALMRMDLQWFSGGGSSNCEVPADLPAVDDFVAVAFDNNNQILAQTWDEPTLYRFDGDEVATIIELEGESVDDTGHDLFHLDAGSGLACASCHPEGGDDGRVWTFADRGPRRTQPLSWDMRGTEPFHWDGDMKNMSVLAREIRDNRMAGATQSDERVGALEEWLFELPAPPPTRDPADTLAAQGRAAFEAARCATCHSGASLTTNVSADLGHGPLQIPTLRGIALRPPYMHDGRSGDLTEATRDMIARTRAPEVTDESVAAIVAYLETL